MPNGRARRYRGVEGFFVIMRKSATARRFVLAAAGAGLALPWMACVGPEPQVRGTVDAGDSDAAGADASPTVDGPDCGRCPDGPEAAGPDAGADAAADVDATAPADAGEAGADGAPEAETGAESGSPDAAPDAPPAMCDVTKPFGAPLLVTSINMTGTETGLRLSADYLSGYFSAQPPVAGSLTMYEAQRTTPTGAFGTPVALTALNATGGSHPCVTGDALTLFFDSTVAPDAGGLGHLDLFLATRATASSTFAPGGALLNVDTANYDETEPFVREDGQVLYFTSTATGGGDLYRSTKVGGAFGVPAPVTELNTASIEGVPTVTADDLVMYFSSTRTDGGALGMDDIWVATRTSTSAPFGTPRNVTELNTTSGERPDFVTRDRCTIYFHRGYVTDAGVSARAVWMASKSP
jgi:WD40-like Beta Propeller Repeat